MDVLTEDIERKEVLRLSEGGKFNSRLRRALLGAFSEGETGSPSKQLGLALLLVIVSLLQSVSLIIRQEPDLPGLESVWRVFRLLNLIRLDVAVVTLGWQVEVWYMLFCLICIAIGLVGVNIVLLTTRKQMVSRYIVRASQVLLALLDVFLIPVLILFLSYIKYTYLVTSSSMSEYSADLPPLVSPSQAVLSFLSLPVLLCVLYLRTYIYNSQFYFRKNIPGTRSESLTLRINLTCRCIIVFFYCFIPAWTGIVVLFLSCYMLFQLCSRLPYYNFTLCMAHTTQSVLTIWIVISHYLGVFTQSAPTIVLLLALFPLLIWLVASMLPAIVHKNTHFQIEFITSPYQVELRLRPYLELLETQGDRDLPEIPQLFTFAYRRFPRCALIAIWEAGFYCYFKRSPSLALLKLTQISPKILTFETGFRLEKAINRFISLENSPERHYLHHLQLLDKAQAADKLSCLSVISLCDVLLRPKSIESKDVIPLKTLEMDQNIHKTVKMYRKVVKWNGGDEEAMRGYGSFLWEIAGEEEGKRMEQRAGVGKNQWERSGNRESVGLLVVGCSQEAAGLIVQATPPTTAMLHCSDFDLHFQPISDFLPSLFRPILATSLSRLPHINYDLTDLQSVFRLLQDPQGFLIPLETTLRITTWGNEAYLLLFLRPVSSQEMVLLDSEDVIVSHTRLDWIVEVPGVKYTGQRVSSVFPGLSMRRGEFHYRSTLGKLLSVSVAYHKVGELAMKLVTVAVQEDRRGSLLFDFNHKEGRRTLILPSAEVKQSVSPANFESKGDLLTSLQTGQPWDNPRDTQFDYTFAISSPFEASLLRRKQRLVSLLTLLSIVIVVLAHISSCIYVNIMLNSLQSITEMRDYSLRNAHVIRTAYHARSLMLSDSAHFPYDVEDISHRLVNISAAIRTITDQMKASVGEKGAKLEQYMTQPTVPMWRVLHTKYELGKESLLDAMYEYVAAMVALAVSTHPYSQSPQAFFLTRNGAGELLEVVNRTLYMEVKDEESDRMTVLKILPGLIGLCVGLTLLPVVLLVLPQLCLLSRLHTSIWQRLHSTPLPTLLAARERAVARLTTCFNSPPPDDSASLPPHSHSQIPPSPRLYPGLTLRFSLYFLLNGAFLTTLFLVAIAPASNLVLTIPNFVFWMNMRADLVNIGQFWTRERLLLTVNPLFTSNSLWPSPKNRVFNSTFTSELIEKILLFGDKNYGLTDVSRSKKHLNYAFLSTCTEDCQVPEAALGSIYVQRSWIEAVFSVFSQPQIPTMDLISTIFPLLTPLETLSEATEHCSDEVSELYLSVSQQDIANLSHLMVFLTVFFVVLLLVMYVLVFRPYFSRVRKRDLEALYVCKQLRVEK